MADTYASHFSINNIPYGIASSSKHPTPQAVTRLADTIIFLSELCSTAPFASVSAPLSFIFQQPTLNTFAALPKSTHSAVRTAIQTAYTSNLHAASSEDLKDVTMHMPVSIGDFTDYSASVNHVLNASEAVTGTRAYPPAYLKYPAGYAGRCSSITNSPVNVTRPLGQFIESYTVPEKKIIFGPSRALDYELELGVIIGTPIEPGSYLRAKDADAHIFGFVLVNDWSARDIQGLEMNPLGPFNGKNFRTSITPWVITLEALEPFKVKAPERMGPVAEFMDDEEAPNYDIQFESQITRNGVSTTTCKVGFETMYWTFRHMLAHHTVGGCGLRTGDLVASGTVSGEKESEHGCLLELTMNGRKPSKLSDGSELRYLEDGDVIKYTGVVGDGSMGVGFGESVGVIGPAKKV
jgi:fumarylacetoacetase